MSRQIRKFVAVLMLLWLPLFTGNALASSIAMQMQQGGCDEAAAMQAMSHQDMGEHHMHHEMPAAADESGTACNDCSLCHLACTGYLAVPEAELVAALAPALETTPYLVVLNSHTSAPLVPPPLARA
ncbi:MAG: DUF2946 domain-containing protein [Gammaproteobacteria bacterium]|nr:DUF2946 domain-containing protein [Gammaproteobacteria bacterium]MBU1777843.1 DUF2946 domain-containing protein [Gammaproteobacteria bacterium]MBU1969295.1 DUF2946 domain-containing protein [Gammaproteobacteria bacterium]